MVGRHHKVSKGEERFQAQFGFQPGIAKEKPKEKKIVIAPFPGLQVMNEDDFQTYSALARVVNRAIHPQEDLAYAVNTVMAKTLLGFNPKSPISKDDRNYVRAHIGRYRECLGALEIGDITVGNFQGKEQFAYGEKGWEPILIKGKRTGMTRTTYFNSQALEKKLLDEDRMYDIIAVAEPPESFYPGENDEELTFEYLGMTKEELERKEQEFKRKVPGYMTPWEVKKLYDLDIPDEDDDNLEEFLANLDCSHLTNNQKRCIEIFKAYSEIQRKLKKAQKDMQADTIPRLFDNIYAVTNQNGILIAHNSMMCDNQFKEIFEMDNHTLYQRL